MSPPRDSLLKELVRPYYLKWFHFRRSPAARPEYFADCWRFPPLDHASIPPAGVLPDLLFLPMTDWHTRIQRTQHLARILAAAGHRCFYLNPHLGREFPEPWPFGASRRLRLLQPGVVEIHIRLPREPVFHHRKLTAGESSQVVSALNPLFGSSPGLVQIVSFPLWGEVAEQLRQTRGFPLVYDCHDVLGGFRQIARELVEAESGLIERSDLAVFSSQNLLESHLEQFPALRDRSILLRNAVDDAWLAQAPEHPVRSGPPVAGYVGALDFWFDIEAIRQAAASHPDWRFVLIGRVEHEAIRALARFPHVEFRGEVPHAGLHRHLAEFDIALIPFLRNELTLGTNPIKVYEYFSHGLPVVSTRLPEMEEFGDLVYLADHSAELVRQMEVAATERDLDLRQRRVERARRETWSARAESLRAALPNIINSD